MCPPMKDVKKIVDKSFLGTKKASEDALLPVSSSPYFFSIPNFT
jgi:hypothetical protein